MKLTSKVPKTTLLVLLIFLFTGLFVYFNSYAKSFVKAALVSHEFIRKYNFAGWGEIFNLAPTLTSFTRPPIVKTVTIETPRGLIKADLWLPNDGKSKHGVVIVNLGVKVARRDYRSIFLADKIARLGVGVLLPDLTGLLDGRLADSDSEDLVSAFKYLEAQDFVKKDKIGFLAFCAASMISLLAAENPEIANKVAYVAVNNLFFNPDRLYQAIVSQSLTDSAGKTYPWRAHFRTIEVFNRTSIEALKSEQDKKILTAYLVDQPEEVLSKREFPIIPPQEFSQLSEDGKKVYQFLVNRDPNLVKATLSQLPESVNAKRYKITAVPEIEKLKAQIFVLADRGNTFTPFTEAEKFVEILPENQYKFLETDLLKNSFLVSDLPIDKAVTDGIKILLFTTSLLNVAS